MCRVLGTIAIMDFFVDKELLVAVIMENKGKKEYDSVCLNHSIGGP